MARPALAATRALDIISFLAEHPNDSFTMAQLTRALRLNQGSAHAILTMLTEHGYLSRHPEHKTFRLGMALVGVGDAAAHANPVLGIAREELQKLSDAIDLPALASMRAEHELRVVVRTSPHVTSDAAHKVGQRYPLVPPIGAVLVAWAPSAVQDGWIDARAEGISGDDLRGLLDAIRRRGYEIGGGAAARGALGAAAQDLSDDPLDEERRLLVRSYASLVPHSPADEVAVVTSPVLDRHGVAVLECAVHGFPKRPTRTTLQRVATALTETCTQIARRADATQ